MELMRSAMMNAVKIHEMKMNGKGRVWYRDAIAEVNGADDQLERDHAFCSLVTAAMRAGCGVKPRHKALT